MRRLAVTIKSDLLLAHFRSTKPEHAFPSPQAAAPEKIGLVLRPSTDHGDKGVRTLEELVRTYDRLVIHMTP